VYKKSSPNNKLTLYLASRDLIVNEDKIDKLQGVLLIDPDYLQEKRVRQSHYNAREQLQTETGSELIVSKPEPELPFCF